MRRASALVGASLALLTLLGACADSSVEIGYIEYAAEPFSIELPDVIVAGEAFIVTVTTYGDGCSAGYSTGVASDGETAVVTPFDLRRLDEDACDDVLMSLTHKTKVVFDTPGMKTVRVHGLKFEPPTETLVDRDTAVLVE